MSYKSKVAVLYTNVQNWLGMATIKVNDVTIRYTKPGPAKDVKFMSCTISHDMF